MSKKYYKQKIDSEEIFIIDLLKNKNITNEEKFNVLKDYIIENANYVNENGYLKYRLDCYNLMIKMYEDNIYICMKSDNNATISFSLNCIYFVSSKIEGYVDSFLGFLNIYNELIKELKSGI